MSESNTVSSKTLLVMCVAAFVGMLSAVAITLAIVMPMMKVGAAPAATTANVDPAYAAYVQGYMAAGAHDTSSYAPVGCGESPASAGATAATVSYGAGGMGAMTPEKMHKSYKEWVKNSYTTNNYHNSEKKYVSNVNSNNTIDSNNTMDNSTHTKVSVKGKDNDVNLNQETKVNNHSFNNDSYNNTVKDSYNKSKTEVNTNVEVNKDTTIINDSFNKKKTDVDVDINKSGNNLGLLLPPVLAPQQS